ncbi:MAG: C40 family peptidase [bacterium]|nr:C40 family peptidase [bacterium]
MKAKIKAIIAFIIVLLFSMLIIGAYKSDKSHTAQTVRKKIAHTAKNHLGTDYSYGGNSTVGFDCSGFVLYVYAQNGIQLPRSSGAQYERGKKIKFSEAEVGDLLFFNITGSGISHVGIYLGELKFIHAPSSGKQVSITTVNNSYWKKRFAGTVSYITGER